MPDAMKGAMIFARLPDEIAALEVRKVAKLRALISSDSWPEFDAIHRGTSADEWRRWMDAALSGDENALQRFILRLPNAARGWFALGAYHSGLLNPGFRRVLADVWDHDHRALLDAVKGRRSIVRSMMRVAAFDVASLPETFPVFRGTSLLSRSKACQGMAWTTSYEVAAWFAMRFGQARPLVLRAEAKRSDVLFHHVERSEDEVILSRDVIVAETVIPGEPEEWARLAEAYSRGRAKDEVKAAGCRPSGEGLRRT